MRYIAAIFALALLLLTLMLVVVPVSSAAYIECADFGVCYGTDEADDMNGTAGYDEMRGREGGDDIRGGGSGDDLFGGMGRDFLKGGGGADAVHGGPGNDDINVSSDDSPGDFADCGEGDNDEVWADPTDAVSLDCEVIHWVF